MGLLTRAERSSLTRHQRRSLRRERRAERRTEGRKGIGVYLDSDRLHDLAAELIRDIRSDEIPGPDKMAEVLDALADYADEFLVWTWAGPFGLLLEVLDRPAVGAVLRLLLRPIVQGVYDSLRDAGEV